MRNANPAPGHLIAVRAGEVVYFYRNRFDAQACTRIFSIGYDDYRQLGGQTLRNRRVTEVLAIFA